MVTNETTMSALASMSTFLPITNGTASPELEIKEANTERIASMTFISFATLLLVYIIIAIGYYGHKNKLMSFKDKTRGTEALINFLTFLAAFFPLIYAASELPLIVPQKEPFCANYHKIKIVSFTMAIFLDYFTLWYRVYSVFYSHPVIKTIIAKKARYLNYISLIILFIIVPMNCIIFLLSPTLVTTSVGCFSPEGTGQQKIRWVVLAASTLTLQILLLISFIYPLRIHERKMADRGFDVKFTTSVIKRAAITAGVCVLSDILNSFFAIFYKHHTTYVNYVIYTSDLLINLIAVIMSDRNWKNKLFPWRCCAMTRS
ncbi:uncharacterized protein LOC143470691 [Clavelina lepadiformis]|uniref:uncharacterized protein LOC143470691 n=1 Tax=Clavelina lepadiformis TaxID=159417 RepID=UPI0040435ACE